MNTIRGEIATKDIKGTLFRIKATMVPEDITAHTSVTSNYPASADSTHRKKPPLEAKLFKIVS